MAGVTELESAFSIVTGSRLVRFALTPVNSLARETGAGLPFSYPAAFPASLGARRLLGIGGKCWTWPRNLPFPLFLAPHVSVRA